MIKLQAVSMQYPGMSRHAVDNVSLTVEDKEIFGVVGESGSGKSTLLKLLNLVVTPTDGTIFFNEMNTDAFTKKDFQEQQKKIAMIFQNYNLLNNKTVAENVALPLVLMGQQDDQQVKDLLEFVNLSAVSQFYPSQLSGGQKQRVAIARALVTKPNLLLCDEPTSALDQRHKDEFIELLKEAHRLFEPTIVFVSHEIKVVKQLCQRVAIFEDGRLLDILPNQVVNDVQTKETYYEFVKARLMTNGVD